MDRGMTLERLAGMRGAAVYSSEGERIGTVEELFMDEETREPEWIGIGTGFFGTKRVLVPVTGASTESDGITVPYSKQQVKDAPDVDGDEISQETEAELYSYYGLDYSERQSDTGLPEGSPGMAETATPTATQTAPTTGEAEVVRAEEELAVGKRQVEAGRVRLRKWVETEPVTMDVDLQREVAQIDRQPIDQPISDAEIGEEVVEVPLHAEQAVVQKQTVAKERVSLDTDVEVETQTVSDELRKERVEVDGDDVRTA